MAPFRRLRKHKQVGKLLSDSDEVPASTTSTKKRKVVIVEDSSDDSLRTPSLPTLPATFALRPPPPASPLHRKVVKSTDALDTGGESLLCDDSTQIDSIASAATFRPADPYEILDRILDDIADDDERGYESFIKKHGVKKVRKIQIAAIRTPVKAIFETREFRNMSKLKAIGGNLKSKAPGTYQDIISDSDDNDFLMLYAGQAEIIAQRIAEHLRKLHLGKTLHHSVASRPTSEPEFVIMAEFPVQSTHQPEDINMHLNIQEMWLGVTFQTLRRKTLETYLKPHEIHISEIGLNISSPLNQNHGQKAKAETARMKYSTNALVQDYYKTIICASDAGQPS